MTEICLRGVSWVSYVRFEGRLFKGWYDCMDLRNLFMMRWQFMDAQEIESRLKTYKSELPRLRKARAIPIFKKHVGKGKGTFIERDLFESDAFLALKGVAPQLLIYLLGKRIISGPNSKNKERICENCDELTLTLVELQKLGITQPRSTRGIDELLAKGFIEIKHHGGAYKRDKSIYALSTQWMFWKPGKIFFERPTIIKRGFQGETRLPEKHFQHTEPLP